MEAMNILLYPFLGCLLLVMIHTYFGVHVLERGIIFVDLALAQFIGLGIAVALLLGYDSDSYLFPLLFALIGASILSLSKYIARIVYIEAFIGVLYIFSFAASILILDKTPHGTEEFKAILNGNILWIGADDVLKMFILYGLIGLFHFIFRRRFLAVSHEGRYSYLWELLFFLSFAFVLASSVRIAGTLQVFVFLVLPALIGRIYTRKPARVLFAGWAIGIAASLFGIVISYISDLPASPVIVAALSLTFMALLAIRFVTQR